MLRTVGRFLHTASKMNLDKIEADFRRNGYAAIENFSSLTDCDKLRSQIKKIVDQFNPDEHPRTTFATGEGKQTVDEYFVKSGDKIRYFFEDKAIVDGKMVVPLEQCFNKIGHALHALDPVFHEFSVDPRIGQVIRRLGIKKPVIPQSMYIFKNAKVGGDVTPHQDSTFLYTNPPSCIGLWWALEDCTLDNGCLFMIPGSHTDPVARLFRPGQTPVFTAPAPEYDDSKFVPVLVPKGTLVLIHGQVVHKSGPNLSDHSRHVYTYHVIESEGVTYSPDNWLQPTEQLPFMPLP